jgi:hypothetical protein
MGFGENRFFDNISDDFKCSRILLCHLIVSIYSVKNASIDGLVNTYLVLSIEQFIWSSNASVIQVFTNAYKRLWLKCEFVSNGCQIVLNIKDNKTHQQIYKLNPKIKSLCDKECGAFISRDQNKSHNCVEYLKNIINQKNEELATNQTVITYNWITKLEIQWNEKMTSNYFHSN